MKILNLRILCFISTIVAYAPVHSQPTGKILDIGGRQLTLQMHTKCPQPRPSRKELAQHLAQYDPKQEEGLTTYDEDRPFSKELIQKIRDSLVDDDFHYPNGQRSVITWLDFDGDGICDFTASAGIGGMKSIDRMFLFRGLPNGKFQLVDSSLSYMDTSIALIPYIPIKVSGEKLPILINPKVGRMLQWQEDHHQLAICKPRSKQAIKNLSKKAGQAVSTLELLCPHMHEIVMWAEKQLPNKNEALNWREPEKP